MPASPRTYTAWPRPVWRTSRIEGDRLDREWRSRTAGAPLITIDLGPLRREEALTLASAFSDAADQFAERCVERAAGNPLFLEQLLRHAEESAEAGIPASVQNLVQARLDRLDPADKTALQAASVLGQSFGRGVLRHLLDRPDYAPERLMAHFLVRPQGERFLFAHALIRDAVYDTLLKSHRRELHRRAAGWFARSDPVLHAEHLDRADDAEAPRAYLAAAQAQAAEYRYELARRLVERGVALAVERADRFALACFQADILHDLGDMTAAGTAYRSALDAAESGAERCRASAVKRVADDLEGAFADLERAEADAVGQGLITEQARIHYLRGNLFFPRGDIDRCLHEHELSRELAQQTGSAELEAAALGGLGDAEYAHGRMATANKHFSRCVELCRAHGLGRTEVANLSMVPATRIYLNELRPALEDSRAAAAAAARVGHHRAELIAHGAACVASRMLGDMSSAREHIERRAPLIQRLGARRFEAVRLRDAAALSETKGRPSEAVELLHRGVAISRETGIRFLGPWLLGQLAATTDDPEVRQQALDEGESLLHAGAVGHNHLWFYHFAIEATLSSRAWASVERYAGCSRTSPGSSRCPGRTSSSPAAGPSPPSGAAGATPRWRPNSSACGATPTALALGSRCPRSRRLLRAPPSAGRATAQAFRQGPNATRLDNSPTSERQHSNHWVSSADGDFSTGTEFENEPSWSALVTDADALLRPHTVDLALDGEQRIDTIDCLELPMARDRAVRLPSAVNCKRADIFGAFSGTHPGTRQNPRGSFAPLPWMPAVTIRRGRGDLVGYFDCVKGNFFRICSSSIMVLPPA